MQLSRSCSSRTSAFRAAKPVRFASVRVSALNRQNEVITQLSAVEATTSDRRQALLSILGAGIAAGWMTVAPPSQAEGGEACACLHCHLGMLSAGRFHACPKSESHSQVLMHLGPPMTLGLMIQGPHIFARDWA